MILLSIILIPVLLIVFLAVPVAVALIYRSSYNKYLNEQMTSGTKAKKRISPFMLGLIIFIIEVVILSGVFVVGVVSFTVNDHNEEILMDALENDTVIYTDEDISDEYAVFNGSDVEGYDRKEESSQNGDFHYFVYKKKGNLPKDKPYYVVNVEYKGNADYNCARTNLKFSCEKDSSSGIGMVSKKSTHYYAIVYVGEMTKRKVIQNEGKQIYEDEKIPPEDVQVNYEMLLFKAPETSDIESYDFDTFSSDTVTEELKIDLSELDF